MTPPDEDVDPGPWAGRRIWQRANPGLGSSQLTLLAMAVLYDAGEPLTREAIAERLLPRLDVYQLGYLEAWAMRRRDVQRRTTARRRGSVIVLEQPSTITPVAVDEAVPLWLTYSFLVRARTGHTLERLPDGRFQPGRTAPRVLTLDGRRIAFTPEAHDLAHAEADAGRLHLVGVAFDRLVKAAGLQTRAARVQLLGLLLRRVGAVTTDDARAFDERTIAPRWITCCACSIPRIASASCSIAPWMRYGVRRRHRRPPRGAEVGRLSLAA
jgi:hypothetical protein